MTVARNARSWRSSPVFITATVGVGFFCRTSKLLLFLLCFILFLLGKERKKAQVKKRKKFEKFGAKG